MTPIWYANAKGRSRRSLNLNSKPGVFHIAGPAWTMTGKALCGADIGRPGYTTDAKTPTGPNKQCQRCLKKAALRMSGLGQ